MSLSLYFSRFCPRLQKVQIDHYVYYDVNNIHRKAQTDRIHNTDVYWHYTSYLFATLLFVFVADFINDAYHDECPSFQTHDDLITTYDVGIRYN